LPRRLLCPKNLAFLTRSRSQFPPSPLVLSRPCESASPRKPFRRVAGAHPGSTCIVEGCEVGIALGRELGRRLASLDLIEADELAICEAGVCGCRNCTGGPGELRRPQHHLAEH